MKRTFYSAFLTLFTLVFLAAGCSDSGNWDSGEDAWNSSEKNNDDSRDRNNDDNYADNEIGEALNQLGNALEEMGSALGNETQTEPVDYRELRDVIPGSIPGMEKGRSSGERSGALGFRVSQVEQIFEEENGDGRVEISIVDLGGLKNIASMGLEWLNLDVDRESDDGYERTRSYRGHPVLDKCERMNRYDKCEMIAYVSKRFVVTLESRGLEMGRLEDIIEEMDIRKLEDMKDDGVVEG